MYMILGSAHCVMVTVLANRFSDPSSKSSTRLFAFQIVIISMGKIQEDLLLSRLGL